MSEFRLSEQDEFPHPVDDAVNFSESMYFNLYDPKQRVGGWFRIGNRPNEGYAEMSVCLFLPGGEVGFMYARPKITANDKHEAGGLKFTVDEPFKRFSQSYRGEILLLKNPGDMIDPKAALFIIGTEMDFVEDEMESGFVFRNPNEKGRCGCGESFRV